MKVIQQRRDGRWEIVTLHRMRLVGWGCLAFAGIATVLGVTFEVVDGSGLGFWIVAVVAAALGWGISRHTPVVMVDPVRKEITLAGKPEGPARFLLAALDSFRPEVRTRSSYSMGTRPGALHFRVRLIGGDTLATTSAYRKRLSREDGDGGFAEQVLFELARERGTLVAGLVAHTITVTIDESAARRVLELVAECLDLVRTDLTGGSVDRTAAAPARDAV